MNSAHMHAHKKKGGGHGREWSDKNLRDPRSHARSSSHNPNKHATLSCAPLPPHWLDIKRLPQKEHPCTDTHAKRRPRSARPVCAVRAVSSFPSSSVEVEESPAKRGKTKLHVSSHKLGVCACVPLVPPCGCARLWPLPQLRSIYTYTPGLYTYMYIYTAYVQIEEEGEET